MTDQKSPTEVLNALCPVCPGQVVSNYVYKMKDSNSEEISYWNRCRCGVVWQHKHPEGVKDYYGEKYKGALLEDKEKFSDSCFYYSRVYAPLLEEMMYGRRMLDVGYCAPYNIHGFSVRGWIPFGIDIHKDSAESSRLVKGDFESYDFPDMVQYDLIWMNHVIENMKDPVAALRKSYDLLTENGCLFIGTPDTDMMITNSQGAFYYWRKHEHYIMWNKDRLTRILEDIGFEVILARRNHDNRFTYADDVHLIAQKRFF